MALIAGTGSNGGNSSLMSFEQDIEPSSKMKQNAFARLAINSDNLCLQIKICNLINEIKS